ncbi:MULTISPECIES: RES family NAD+ phosphorylase [unclassified Bradyrhizobium]|uniref:RES family NAD+ phosphorylase n=1 Tax=unclassified Bradyrhizobium TaxID=2631580 RepID=UPI002915C8A0|nr:MULTISPECIES: RES family NAD+ phosphorylase [unclassified Bradyrhizobium]
MGAFKSWSAYSDFSREVQRRRRYIRTEASDDFLIAVAATCKERLRPVRAGHIFWRAQLGNDWDTTGHKFEVAVAFGPKRMKPLDDRAMEGRANPKGIPRLYLSTSENAAMSEVRPWIGAMVSLAQFKIVRELTLVDCSVLHGKYVDLILDRTFDEPIPPEKFDQIVWAAIDRAFSEPTTRADDTAEYTPTQVLAEFFESEGYDGVAYKSAFGEDGFNIALFDLGAAIQVNGSLYETKSVKFEFEEMGNPYFITHKKET